MIGPVDGEPHIRTKRQRVEPDKSAAKGATSLPKKSYPRLLGACYNIRSYEMQIYFVDKYY